MTIGGDHRQGCHDIFLSLYLKKCIVLSPQRKQYNSRHTIQQDDAADRKIIQLRFYNQRI